MPPRGWRSASTSPPTSSASSALQRRIALVATRDGYAELVRVLDRQVQEGTSAEGDLRRLQAELARLELALARVDIERRQASARLCQWMARPSCEGLELVAPPLVAPGPLAAEQVTAAIEARPDVEEARSRLEAARLRQTLAGARLVPDLAITAGYKRMQDIDTAMAGVSVTMPLFDRQSAERHRAAAEHAAAAHRLESARRLARTEIETQAALARDLQVQAVRVEAGAIVPAQVARQAADRAFREGAADLLRLLDAERTLADARRDAIELQVDALHATLFLRYALAEEIP